MKHETAVMGEATSLRTGAYWMPFTHNRYLKKNPRSRILARAEGAYYTTASGHQLTNYTWPIPWCPRGTVRPTSAKTDARQHTDHLQTPTELLCRLTIATLPHRTAG